MSVHNSCRLDRTTNRHRRTRTRQTASRETGRGTDMGGKGTGGQTDDRRTGRRQACRLGHSPMSPPWNSTSFLLRALLFSQPLRRRLPVALSDDFNIYLECTSGLLFPLPEVFLHPFVYASPALPSVLLLFSCFLLTFLLSHFLTFFFIPPGIFVV